MQIKTNNTWKYFKCKYEVPDNIINSRFDWLDKSISDGFINYNNEWYHVSQFINCNDFEGWDGVNTLDENKFLLIRIDNKKDKYQLGVYSK